MGNCSLKGVTGECQHSIRVLSDCGAVLQFRGPKTVGEVLQHYPGYGIFRQGHASSPLPEQASLCYGLLYYLLPLEEVGQNTSSDNGVSEAEKSLCAATSESVQNWSNGSAFEVLPSARNGVWRVKLVIDTRQLEEILSKQVNTEALIEKMRMAASASSTSPARSRAMSSWKLTWIRNRKPTLFNTSRLSLDNGMQYNVHHCCRVHDQNS